MFAKLFKKEPKKITEFARFIREAPAREQKKVYMEVLKQATADQRKLIEKSRNPKTA
ncbi:MAG: hypothetical protein KBB55_03025 [Candidatus Buchananbacteria bacterium]|nr:hypothetical protein [Candidatus Buchananbacteria bacterium]